MVVYEAEGAIISVAATECLTCSDGEEEDGAAQQ